MLLEQILLAGLPEPKTQYRFHANCQWRFDFCWRPQRLVACEIEGGIWMQTDTVAAKAMPTPTALIERLRKIQ